MVPLDPPGVRLGVEHGVVLVHAEQLGRGEGEEEVDVVVVLFLVLLAWRDVLLIMCEWHRGGTCEIGSVRVNMIYNVQTHSYIYIYIAASPPLASHIIIFCPQTPSHSISRPQAA